MYIILWGNGSGGGAFKIRVEAVKTLNMSCTYHMQHALN